MPGNTDQPGFHLEHVPGLVAFGVGRCLRRYRVGKDHGPRLRMGANAVDLKRGKARIDQHRPGIEQAGGEQGGDGRCRILVDDDDAVAAANTGGRKDCRHGPNSVTQLAISQAPAVALDECERIGPVPRPMVERMMDAVGERCRIDRFVPHWSPRFA